MVRQPGQEHVKSAFQTALRHGMFVIERGGAFILYRKTDNGNVRLGRRTTPDGICRFVARAAQSTRTSQ